MPICFSVHIKFKSVSIFRVHIYMCKQICAESCSLDVQNFDSCLVNLGRKVENIICDSDNHQYKSSSPAKLGDPLSGIQTGRAGKQHMAGIDMLPPIYHTGASYLPKRATKTKVHGLEKISLQLSYCHVCVAKLILCGVGFFATHGTLKPLSAGICLHFKLHLNAFCNTHMFEL